MRNNSLKLSKRAWYAAGGFSNPRLYRRMRGGSWQYFYRND